VGIDFLEGGLGMQKKFGLNLRSTISLTTSALFLVGLTFGLVETSVIMASYKYLLFASLFEKALFFLFCVLIYPVVFGILGIPLGIISYYLSEPLKRISNRVSTDHFLIACYICIGILALVGIRLGRIIYEYQQSVQLSLSLYQCIIVFLAVFALAVFAFMGGIFISRLLKNSESRVPISICFIISLIVLGVVCSFVKTNVKIAKAEGTSEPFGRTSTEKIWEIKPPKADLRKTNVILISIDTLRADHLSCYGYRRKTSPNIDSFARKSVLFTGAKTQTTSTAPSLASVLTGTYPNRHLLNANKANFHDFNITLAETLKKYDYKTAAFQTNINAGTRFGFNQGFDYFEDWNFIENDTFSESRSLNSKIIPWLRKNSGQKFFLWIHYLDPHTPYIVPPEYERLYIGDSMYGKNKDKKIKIGDSPYGEIKHQAALKGTTDIDYYVAQYDAEIKFNDDSIGELFRVFDELNLFQNSLIILTADHGESLGEHNYYFSHGDNTYGPTAWVPLVIYHSSLPAGRVISNLVELVDIYPTVTELLGLSTEPQVQGRSLLSLVFNNSSDSKFEYAHIVGSYNFGYQTHAIQDKRWKLIFDVNEYWVYFDKIVESRLRFWEQKMDINPYRSRVFKTELYDLENDPGETRNLIASGLVEEDKLRGLLFEWLDSGNYQISSDEVNYKEKLDKDTVEKLKALGYVN